MMQADGALTAMLAAYLAATGTDRIGSLTLRAPLAALA